MRMKVLNLETDRSNNKGVFGMVNCIRFQKFEFVADNVKYFIKWPTPIRELKN